MQYIKHNFAENYRNFTKAGEIKQRNAMLIDEIAKLIVFDRQGLLLAISISGYKFLRRPKKSDFVLFFKKYIPVNAKLRTNLAKLIIINNSNSKVVKSKVSEFNTKETYTVGNRTYGKQKVKEEMTSQNELSNGLSFSFDASLDSRVEQHTINKLVMDNEIVSKEEMGKELKKAKIKTVLYTTAILVGGYYLINWVAKKYAVSLMFEQGGAVSTPEPTPTPTPMPQPQVTPPDGFDEFGLKVE